MTSGHSNDERYHNVRSNSAVQDLSQASEKTSPHQGCHQGAVSSSLNSHSSNDEARRPNMDDQVSTFQAELTQKDELIAALIHELEQAAEQLDRIQRQGNDRSLNNQSPTLLGSASESLTVRSPLMDDLRRMAEDWDQSQPASALARIESELATVNDLLRNLQRSDFSRTVNDFVEPDSRHDHVADAKDDSNLTDMTLDAYSPGWDAIKSQLFTPQPELPDTNDAEILKAMVEIPQPTEINYDVADIDQFKRALDERDAYIVQLSRLFRTRNAIALPIDWAALANVPADMQIQVSTLINNLDVQVRLGEVEMSLERARLSRERSQIQSDREIIEKHLKRLGLNSLSELDNIGSMTGSTTDRRWMRFMGQGKK